MPQTANATQPNEQNDVLVIKASMAASRLIENLPLNPVGRDLLNVLRLAYIQGGMDMIDMATGVLREHDSEGRDAAPGIAWWNGLSEPQRREWMHRAGDTGIAADAWECFKRTTEARADSSGYQRHEAQS